jgi:hypothetical protein
VSLLRGIEFLAGVTTGSPPVLLALVICWTVAVALADVTLLTELFYFFEVVCS